jgi:hypothetical protein
MENLVLYCKSFKRDVDIAKDLLISVEKFNRDKIPFYMSVPEEDIPLFSNRLGTRGYHLISDESIVKMEMPSSWITQQVIKSSFWKLGISDNYLLLDSDSFFIKDFYKNDFLYDDIIPFTVMHEQQDLFEWSSINKDKLGFDPHLSFIEDRKKIMKILGIKNQRVIYDGGPPPCIWSKKVWSDLEENYIKPNKRSFFNLIQYCPSEISWYEYSLLAFNSIPIYPRSPLFKFYHYQDQYSDSIKVGHTVESLKENYLGIVMQSNWSL